MKEPKLAGLARAIRPAAVPPRLQGGALGWRRKLAEPAPGRAPLAAGAGLLAEGRLGKNREGLAHRLAPEVGPHRRLLCPYGVRPGPPDRTSGRSRAAPSVFDMAPCGDIEVLARRWSSSDVSADRPNALLACTLSKFSWPGAAVSRDLWAAQLNPSRGP